MRKIYLVKKNPEQPADGNNWIVMNSFEFMNFVKTPEGQKRKACFGQLDACSVDDVIIIAECGAETAKIRKTAPKIPPKIRKRAGKSS